MSTRLPHHVVLKNGRDDVVCACGEHFRREADVNHSAEEPAPDAIQQWVAHWKAADAVGETVVDTMGLHEEVMTYALSCEAMASRTGGDYEAAVRRSVRRQVASDLRDVLDRARS